MSFAMSLPGWNSFDSVRRVHSDLEAAALVFFALLVLFDVLAHLADDRARERILERIGLWFFAVAVFSEMIAYPYGQRNDTLSGQIIVSLDAKAEEARAKGKEAVAYSSTALSQAKDALAKAGAAQQSLAGAENDAKKAQAAASNALTLARSAESHLNDALERAARAEKSAQAAQEQVAPRKIKTENMTAFIRCLGGLKGKRLWLVGQGGGPTEVTDFALQLDSAFKKAGVDFPGVNLPQVPGGVLPGITVWAGEDRRADADLLTNCIAAAANIPASTIKREKAEGGLGLSVGYQH